MTFSKKLTQAFLTSLLVLSGMQLANAKTVKPFEGTWRTCFMYQGIKICTGYDLVQRKQNVCGTWSYFATGMYQGQLQAIATGKSTAKLTQICGRSGSSTQTECQPNQDSTEESKWETPSGDVTALKLCHGQLFDGTGTCHNASKKELGHRYTALSSTIRQQLLSEPWVKSCLSQ